MRKVIIVGSGLSGLAAGIKLSASGHRVRILEQRSFPGGRTYSFRDRQSGDIVDNGQHLLLDCYTRTLKYLSIIGAQNLVRTEPELNIMFVHPKHGSAHLRVSRKISPRAALIGGLSAYSFLSFSDRLKLLKIGHQLFHADEKYLEGISGLTVEEWLNKNKQSERLKKNFWYPFAISIMNESVDIASVEVFIRSMKLGIFDTKGPANIVTPLRGLSDVFITPAVTFISKNGGSVDCSRRMTDLITNGRKVTGVKLQNGESVTGDAFIVTGQPIHLEPVLKQAGVNYQDDISYTPIITCNIWFDREVDIPPRTGMIDTEFQWVFKKDNSFAGNDGHGYLSLVMSGARRYVAVGQKMLMNLALDELRACFPTLRDANVVHYQIIKERRATVSISPSVQKRRPGNHTQFDNAFIAGDWTQTHLPATIEGAIMSGFTAADLVMGG